MTALGWEHLNARERKRLKFIADICLDDEFPGAGAPEASGWVGLDEYRKVLIEFSPAYMRFLKRKLDNIVDPRPGELPDDLIPW